MTDDFNLIWLILGVDLKFFSSTIFAIFQQKMHVFACCKKINMRQTLQSKMV